MPLSFQLCPDPGSRKQRTSVGIVVPGLGSGAARGRGNNSPNLVLVACLILTSVCGSGTLGARQLEAVAL